MKIISNNAITYETALDIKVSHLLMDSIVKKYKVSVELVRLIKNNNYTKNLKEMRKEIKRNSSKGQRAFEFGV